MNKPQILLIHGVNLNLLGQRQTELYGDFNSEQLLSSLQNNFHNIEISYFQSNHESEVVEKIQSSTKTYHGIIINAGAFSHTSIAIADALKSIQLPAIAVHITNIYQREPFRHVDIVGESCNTGAIVGLGIAGYQLALETLLDKITI
ncbi:MAG: type II 3-dehydroquinate dehydratase [Bacteroidota bacterium]|nr:type II 3-dehydroquinate dehydratase [Bacteroidota bacterium]